jgi:hypothetical protein
VLAHFGTPSMLTTGSLPFEVAMLEGAAGTLLVTVFMAQFGGSIPACFNLYCFVSFCFGFESSFVVHASHARHARGKQGH